MQSGCLLVLRSRLNLSLTASRGYVTQLSVHPPQLLRSLPGQVPKFKRPRRYSTSTSSLSSSSPSSSGGFTTPTNNSPERKPSQVDVMEAKSSPADGELQKILPALQKVVPVLAPGRHKGQAGKSALVLNSSTKNLKDCRCLNGLICG